MGVTMATIYFRDAAGNYIGGFDGAAPPVGAIEVPNPPEHAGQRWTGTTWGAKPAARARDKQYSVGDLVAVLKAKGIVTDDDVKTAEV